jgi:two-component system, cell cycle sensor histidine kinase and response regulator CckA
MLLAPLPGKIVKAQAPQPKPLRAVSILVVDDEEPVRDFVQRVLDEAGYGSSVAESGLAALRLVSETGAPDLLLTDLGMPGMRGDELAATMRRASPDLKVLYLTGYSDQLFTERKTLWENETYLDKPCSVKGLIEAVNMALYGRLESGASTR